MAGRHEVKQFLDNFKAKLSVWGVFFRDDRGKNTQALLDLDITPAYRETVLKHLQPEDYAEGPLEEKLWGGAPMWVFGVELAGKEKGRQIMQEVYIKITMGAAGAKTICISFHLAERKMNYPLKS